MPDNFFDLFLNKNRFILNMPLIKTAFSSHKRCFICYSASFTSDSHIRKNSVKLRSVKKASLKHAYNEYQMIIKQHSRCCGRHQDNNGLIIPEEFHKIPWTLKMYDDNEKNMFDCLYLESNQTNIFDKFRDIDELDENHCFNVTR